MIYYIINYFILERISQNIQQLKPPSPPILFLSLCLHIHAIFVRLLLYMNHVLYIDTMHVCKLNLCNMEQPTAPPAEEDLELVMAINASIQSALQERLPIHETSASSSSTTSMDSGDWSGHESGPRWDSTLHTENHDISTIQTTATSDSIPSSPTTTTSSSSSCVICWDGPVEGAFIPCGHMAGCMPCLNEINAKNWDCPVCRGKVDQVIRLYAV